MIMGEIQMKYSEKKEHAKGIYIIKTQCSTTKQQTQIYMYNFVLELFKR